MTGVESGELDEAMAAVVDGYVAEGLPAWHTLSVSGARDLEAELFGGGAAPEMAAVRDLAIDGPGGDLPIRVYRPQSAAGDGDPAEPNRAEVDPHGVLVFLHGGLFVLGTLDSADDICRALAARTGCVVCSVDYRLAPEHPFPAAVDDAIAATQWVREHAASLGAGSGNRVGVVGSSAGGALAAATAIHAAETDAALAVQALLYPMLGPAVAPAAASTAAVAHRSEGSSRAASPGASAGPASWVDGDEIPAAYREHADAALLGAADVAWGWRQYLRSPVDANNPYAAPGGADAGQLAGTAPAVVATAGVDVLRDDGAAYADRLADAGVDVTHAHYPTLAHGFASMTDDVPLADDALDEVADAVRTHVA